MRRPPSSPLFPYTTLFRSDLVIRVSPDLTIGATSCRPSGPEASPLARLRRGDWHAGRGGGPHQGDFFGRQAVGLDRKSTRLNSSHSQTSYAVFCLKKTKTRPWPAHTACALRSRCATPGDRSRATPAVPRALPL